MRGEFGYWVFTGEHEKLQRPSWNYRKEDDGGIIVDMLCHWQYVIQNLFGEVKSLSCLGATHIPQRWDESGKPYKATADDSAYATFELVNGVGGSAVRPSFAKPFLASSKAACGSVGMSADATPKNDPSAVPVYSG